MLEALPLNPCQACQGNHEVSATKPGGQSIEEKHDILSLHKRIHAEDMKAIIKELYWEKETRQALCVFKEWGYSLIGRTFQKDKQLHEGKFVR